MIDLLIAADSLGREAFGDQSIDTPAQLIELFIFAANDQTIPGKFIFIGAIDVAT